MTKRHRLVLPLVVAPVMTIVTMLSTTGTAQAATTPTATQVAVQQQQIKSAAPAVVAAKSSCKSVTRASFGYAIFKGSYYQVTYGKCYAKRAWGQVKFQSQVGGVLCGAAAKLKRFMMGAGIVCGIFMVRYWNDIKSAWSYAVKHEGSCPRVRVYAMPGVNLVTDHATHVKCIYPKR